MGTSRTRGQWKEDFLKVLSQFGNVSHACRAAHCSTITARAMREQDEEFRERWDEALDQFRGRLEHALVKRGVDGVKRGVWYQGEQVGQETEYSDTLLQVALKANMPEKYKDRDGDYAAKLMSDEEIDEAVGRMLGKVRLRKKEE